MIRVIVADDQRVIRDGIKLIIEQDPEVKVVGCAGNGREAFDMCGSLNPDMVLMDIVMPVCDGVEGTKLIKEKFSTIKVIILTTFKDDANISKALVNGADGYVLKDIESAELILTMKSVHRGLRVMQEDVFGTVVKRFEDDEKAPAVGNKVCDIELTEKELSIIKLIVYGKGNKEIASTLYLSEGSVRNTISAILAKLGLKDRTQLAVYAVENKLVGHFKAT